MLQALPKDGRLMALDKDPNTMEMAKRFFAEAGVAHKARHAVCTLAAGGGCFTHCGQGQFILL